MRLVDEIQRLSYSPRVASIVRGLGLLGIARGAYGRVYGLPRVLNYSIATTQACFQARDVLELRILEGTWLGEQDMLNGVLSRLAPGDVFLDAGSNLGVFTVFAARAVGARGSVYAFEPEGVANARLLENVRLNDLHNVTAFKKALSSGRETRFLSTTNRYGVSQSSRISETGQSGETIETVDFDWLVEHFKLSVPTVVKIDVEGHEYLVLNGMRQTLSNPTCRAVFCEIHPQYLPDGVNSEMVLELIESCGFTIVSNRQRTAVNFHVIGDKGMA